MPIMEKHGFLIHRTHATLNSPLEIAIDASALVVSDSYIQSTIVNHIGAGYSYLVSIR